MRLQQQLWKLNIYASGLVAALSSAVATIVSKYAIEVLVRAALKPSSQKLAAIAAAQSYNRHSPAAQLHRSVAIIAYVAQSVDIRQLSTIATLKKPDAPSAPFLLKNGALAERKSYIASLATSKKQDAASLAERS